VLKNTSNAVNQQLGFRFGEDAATSRFGDDARNTGRSGSEDNPLFTFVAL
jgi:hypothetical protein